MGALGCRVATTKPKTRARRPLGREQGGALAPAKVSLTNRAVGSALGWDGEGS